MSGAYCPSCGESLVQGDDGLSCRAHGYVTPGDPVKDLADLVALAETWGPSFKFGAQRAAARAAAAYLLGWFTPAHLATDMREQPGIYALLRRSDPSGFREATR